jgi:hypothetical protein
LPEQDVQQLRELIQFPLAQQQSDYGNLLTTVCCHWRMRGVCTMTQGSELQDFEGLPFAPHAILQEENWAGGRDPNRQTNYQTEWQNDRKERENASYVEKALRS